MKQRKRVEWTKLDNASKIFPATSNNTDTKVFRIACELLEKVDPSVLQQALDITIDSFPFYRSVLRNGVFWHYFESSELNPLVHVESLPVCAPIYNKNTRNLLFRVFYFNNRISFEIFHALSDGTGGLHFMKTLIYHYLSLTYKSDFTTKISKLKYNASISEKMKDSFDKYFEGSKSMKGRVEAQVKEPIAYRIRGSKMEENRMNYIEGSMSVKDLLNEAHNMNTTLTVYIASLYIYSIYMDMPAKYRKRPIALSIPVDLRNYFNSATTRNFFSTFNVHYSPKDSKSDFLDILNSVSNRFKDGLTEDKLLYRLNHLMSLEKKPFARAIPLPFKEYILKFANFINSKKITATVSNVGKITMPKEFSPYIKQFSVCTSARRPQICLCSYGDRLVIGYTSPFQDTEIPRLFFKSIAEKGIEVDIVSNN